MQIEPWAADRLAEEMATMLTGGHVDVFDVAGTRLARCHFSSPAFGRPQEGSISANPFQTAVAEADGAPARFEARDFDDTLVLAGTAGYKDALPAPELKFKTRVIVKDADVGIESFVFAVVRKGQA